MLGADRQRLILRSFLSLFYVPVCPNAPLREVLQGRTLRVWRYDATATAGAFMRRLDRSDDVKVSHWDLQGCRVVIRPLDNEGTYSLRADGALRRLTAVCHR